MSLKKLGAFIFSSYFLFFSSFYALADSTNLITEVKTENITEQSAEIIWISSDKDQLSFITFVYGLTESYGKRGSPRSLSTSIPGDKLYFEITLNNLEAGKQYYYKIQASDSKGSQAYTGTFTTLLPDKTKPIITNVSVFPQMENATITWQTDEPANSFVSYTEEGGNSFTKKITEYTTSHNVFISGLESNTKYSFTVSSEDPSGNESTSNLTNFQTLSKILPPANVSSLRSLPSNNAITLYWKNPIDSGFDRVEIHKKVGSPVSSRTESEPIFSGNVESYIDKNVSAGKTYYYTVYSRNSLGSYSGGAVVADAITLPVEAAPAKKTDPISISDDIKGTVETIKNISESPEVEKSVEVFVPTVAGFTLLSVFSSFTLINLLPFIHIFLLEPFVFLGRRRRIGWGKVYNSITKHPVDLAVVRLIDKKTGKVVQSKVSDNDGRFAFFAKPGEYVIQVTKDKFTFPSGYLRGIKDDGQIFDIYHGGTFEVKKSESLITANIPIDPPGDHEPPFRFKIFSILTSLQGVVSWIGLPITLLAVFLSPHLYMWLLLLAQILLFYLYKRISQPIRIKNWGVVYDARTKKPIKRAVVMLFNTSHDRLAGTQVTDEAGRYYFLAGNGKYYMVCESSDYQTYKTPTINLVDRKKQSITLDIGMDAKVSSKVS